MATLFRLVSKRGKYNPLRYAPHDGRTVFIFDNASVWGEEAAARIEMQGQQRYAVVLTREEIVKLYESTK